MNPTMPSESQQQAQASKQTEKPPFSKDLIIMEAVEHYPEAVEVFLEYGLHCIGCHISGYETIEEGAMGHGIVGDDLENMMLDAKEKIEGTPAQ